MRILLVSLMLASLIQPPQAAAQGERRPTLVSPVEAIEARVASVCPTFSWAAVDGAVGYELAVFEVGRGAAAEAALPPPEAARLRMTLPRGATSWTPSLGRCLSDGERYVWTVAARFASAESLGWSEPAVFRIEAAPPAGQRERRAERDVAASRDPAVRLPSLPGPSSLALGEVAPRPRSAPAYTPLSCIGPPLFSDVPNADLSCPWIEKIAGDGILAGCGGGKYCPDNPVTRRQLAVALERVMRGTDTWRPALGNAATVVGPPSQATNVGIDLPEELDRDSRLSMTIGIDGLPFITLGTDDDADLFAVHCSDLDCAAATVTRLDDIAPSDVTQTGIHSSVAIGHDGLPIISYSDDGAGLKVAHCSNIECTAATIHIVDPLATGHDNSITVPDDGRPVIAYSGPSGLKLAGCVDSSCTATDYAVDVDTSVVDGSISVASVGTSIWISYATDGLRVATCAVFACEFFVDIRSLDPGVPAGHTSIVIGDDLLPLISYAATVPDDLKVAHCDEPTCEFVSVFTVTTQLTALGLNAITIGTDGLGMIAHAGNSLIAFQHCNDRACSTTAGGFSRVSDAEDINAIALAIGADGLPIVAMTAEQDNFGFPVVSRCPNSLCVGFFRRR